MQKVILTNYKLDSDPKLYETKDGEHKYYVFFASSVKPSKTGTYIKFSVQAWEPFVTEIERLKLHKGSLVDIVAEMEAYSKNGNLSYYLVIKDISIADGLHEREKKDEETVKEEPTKVKQRKLLAKLESEPFG